MSWNNEGVRGNYFDNTDTNIFLNLFYSQDRLQKIRNTTHPNNFPFDLLKELIFQLTIIMPTGHFGCPGWDQPFQKTEHRLLLIIGRADAGGAIKSDYGRRVGVFYFYDPTVANPTIKPTIKLYIFAFGANNQVLTKNDCPEGWSLNSNYFTPHQLQGQYNQFMVYDQPYEGGDLPENLKVYLGRIHDSYGNNELRILGNSNVITPLTISQLKKKKNPDDKIEDEDDDDDPPGEQIKMTLNTIYYGPPGTGKTHITISKSVEICVGTLPETEKEIFDKYKELQNVGRIVFVTFHQSYGYEEFIQGLRPVVEKNGNGGNSITYEVIPGVFKKLCEEARKHVDQNYVIIIDEINRANISKVFGELITLLEESKRSGGENKTPFSVKLPNYLNNNESGERNLGEDFSVPSNLYVIGTMNTADRSIALLDTALRRRFHFEELMPDYSKLGTNVGDINLQELLRKINTRIEEVYDRDHMIGHAYFFGKTTFEDIQMVFKRQIIPLLTEYFYDDFRKIQYVLNDTNDSFITEKKTKEIQDSKFNFEIRSEIYQVSNNLASLDAIKRIYDGT